MNYGKFQTLMEYIIHCMHIIMDKFRASSIMEYSTSWSINYCNSLLRNISFTSNFGAIYLLANGI